MSRTRRNDAVFAEGNDEVGRQFARRRAPAPDKDYEDDIFLNIPIEKLQDHVPSYDDRRTMLARDSLASVDGFRIIVALTMEFLFGLRCCPFDPDCNNGEHACPCQDIFGSSSSPEPRRSTTTGTGQPCVFRW